MMCKTFSLLSALMISALILGLGHLHCSAEAATNSPNIVLVLADDLGWVDMSTGLTNFGNGSSYHETPNIDRLAVEGMSFPQAYTQQNCQPTRAALISGQYAPHRFNGVHNVGGLNRASRFTPGFPDLPIIPPAQASSIDPAGTSLHEVLKSAGYHTSWFGKTHGTGFAPSLPANHGVDHNYATDKLIKAMAGGKAVSRQYLALNDDTVGWKLPIPELAPYAQPYDQAYVDSVLSPLSNGNNLALLLSTPKHMTDAIGDAAVDYIRQRTQTGEPFFVYLPFHAVHTETVSRLDLTDKYQNKTSTDPRHDDPVYAGFVELLDQNVGKVMGALDDPNGDGNTNDSVAANTLFIFYSDNGGDGRTDNTPLNFNKGRFAEGGIRVPLICRWPGVIAPQTVSTQSIHCVDIYPTLAAVAGATLPDPKTQIVDGESFAPILRGEASGLVRDNLYWHFPGYMDSRQRPNSVIQKRVKGEYYKLYFYYEYGGYELYNLTQDIGENTNLLAGKPGAAVLQLAQEMNVDLRNWLVKADAVTGQWALNGETVPYPPADMKSYRIPRATTEIVIKGVAQLKALTTQNLFYPGPGGNSSTIARSQVHDSMSNPSIPAGATVTVRYSFDITAGPKGTISRHKGSQNGIGVDDGTGGAEPLDVDADNGSDSPEWLKIGNLTIDDVVINDPGGTLPTKMKVSGLRAVNFMPANTSSNDLIITVSGDADHTTSGDNDSPRSAAANTLTNRKWENALDRTNDFHFIVTQGKFWLKGLEVAYEITFDAAPQEDQ